ncbi:signal peptidase II [Mycoplasmopsis felifaucium]|uniref:Lipoprotein signal peptidase n=1 Tax=Mycoplasmopsis felifaucium TaxID=35768 RepID=A0ABZ2RPE1_9BACT|nr:signal peptidase II [Mycoplasmopsis felifaucium]
MKESKSNISFTDKLKVFIKSIKLNWKSIVFKYILFIAVFVCLLLIDQITKNFIFGEDSSMESFLKDVASGKSYDFGIIGFKALDHHGVTVLSNKNLGDFGFMIIHVISILLFIIMLSLPLFIEDHVLIILVAGIAAGDIGNFIDRMRFNNTVKDIIYSPFIDRWMGRSTGVFNFADTFIIGGIITMVVYLLFRSSNSSMQEKLNDQNMAYELFVDPKVLDEIEKENKKSGIDKLFS